MCVLYVFTLVLVQLPRAPREEAVREVLGVLNTILILHYTIR